MRTRRSQSSSDPMSLNSGHRTPQSPIEKGHRTVLLHESLQLLDIQPDDVVLDATLGGAGHARAIIRTLGSNGRFIGIDADANAILRAREALEGSIASVHLEKENFRNTSSLLERLGISHIDKALFDLGWSGYQLTAGRGFSFLADEPLLMTYADATDASLTAAMIVNEWKEESIADVLYGWGEERYSRQIARGIIEARKVQRITTAHELADIIARSVPSSYRKGRLHPATKTFQALRIAVNDELSSLKEGMRGAWKSLRVGGRLAVISFHSIEDREVKRLMLEWSQSGEGVRITKSPITPSRTEIVANPRSRSGKLRVIQRK